LRDLRATGSESLGSVFVVAIRFLLQKIRCSAKQ
jgi:hypothetical protein